jgi:hypothetical protein
MKRFCFLTAALALLGASPAHADVRPPGDGSPLRTERLSDERTVSRWAHAVEPASVRVLPERGAATVGRLRFQTEEGLPEVYLVLRSKRVDGRVWLKLRLPQRPNGIKGWVLRDSLSELRTVTTFLRVDLRHRRATLYDDGRRIWRSPVGVGAPATPTPAGRFYVRQRLRGLAGNPMYGPWAFGTSAYSTALSDWPGGGVVGIHGTDRPDLIPGRPSHGCVRVPNAAIRRLARLMPIGTPVLIR